MNPAPWTFVEQALVAPVSFFCLSWEPKNPLIIPPEAGKQNRV